ncbi:MULTISPECIES: SCO5918 family protein [unclassified Streptomyces]|uniref:SCO5918 family protein n=1 Tax=unclassified Streptomyces TaxID=2593676 RepID=UPI002250EAF6|nr:MULTISPECIES: SCO5918 family protein [unclassified Streptomyces]MCX5049717.1 SCO5918 family protein [Streptomyces sp. NBC_00474]MCX5055555.1 SCO5918 family protein [Streptomyces sp. NBC_00452]MCX5247599.1 SCO5918 family protein [Streptomyces sp. NBC_00201]MCX5286620.1 SCO5918 family protein [Streptomyces sp. NBC_00183]
MRCVIARFPFDFTKFEVEHSMEGIKPEAVTGVSVTIGRRTFPVMQVGEIITRQNRRDFTVGEVRRALTRLGFTCHDAPPAPPAAPASPADQPAPWQVTGVNWD